jgi:Fur family transcriptional regulator, zinc uptake regulator
MARRAEKTRTHVLDVLRRNSAPMSAYGVLNDLRKTNPRISPPTIYRALAVLCECGQVHRIESMNAFVACQNGGHKHASILSICNACGAVDERVAPELLRTLSRFVGQSGFMTTRQVVEFYGSCGACKRQGLRT